MAHRTRFFLVGRGGGLGDRAAQRGQSRSGRATDRGGRDDGPSSDKIYCLASPQFELICGSTSPLSCALGNVSAKPPRPDFAVWPSPLLRACGFHDGCHRKQDGEKERSKRREEDEDQWPEIGVLAEGVNAPDHGGDHQQQGRQRGGPLPAP